MKMTDLKHGDKLVADGGFTCLIKNQVVMVNDAKDGKFVHCRAGRHYLDGQEDEDGTIVGFEKIEGK